MRYVFGFCDSPKTISSRRTRTVHNSGINSKRVRNMKNPLFSFANCLRHAFMTGAGYGESERISDADQRRWCEYDPPNVGSFSTMADVLASAARDEYNQTMSRKDAMTVIGHATDFSEAMQRATKLLSELRPPARTGVVIVAAAIRIHANGSDFVISVPRPGRHHDIHSAEAFPLEYAYTEGFLTSAGTFVDRENALELAIKAGQFNAPAEGKRELFSEDLW
ncbi:hypothetical protein Milano_115 [Agrobacterium phage Milano]|nr:hypothetical protein Milano_115 [Agrobacterium phage Milano]